MIKWIAGIALILMGTVGYANGLQYVITTGQSNGLQYIEGTYLGRANIVGVAPYLSVSRLGPQGQIFWYRNDGTWLNAELYYASGVDAYCGAVFEGKDIQQNLISIPFKPKGEVCIDRVERYLVIGYAMTHRSFGCYAEMYRTNIGDILDSMDNSAPSNFSPLQNQYTKICSGSLVLK